MISSVIKSTRTKMGLDLRRFAALVGCSHATIDYWERGRSQPGYEVMYYLYTHTDNSEVRTMAGECMRLLDTDKWTADIQLRSGLAINHNAP